MWSHYASKHSGICLEFDVRETHDSFEFLLLKNNKKEWKQLKRILYEENQPFLSFYDFYPAFANDIDLNQTNSWDVSLRNNLETLFSIKTNVWADESEWRMIEVNFDRLYPEQRLYHYPIENLSAIYFGMRTPIEVKNRIRKILSLLSDKIQYFDSISTGSRIIKFEAAKFDI